MRRQMVVIAEIFSVVPHIWG